MKITLRKSTETKEKIFCFQKKRTETNKVKLKKQLLKLNHKYIEKHADIIIAKLLEDNLCLFVENGKEKKII